MARTGRLRSRSRIQYDGYRAGVDADLRGLFPTAAASTLDSLARSAETCAFERGGVLIERDGEWRLGLVVDGWLGVRRVSSGGRRLTVAAIGPGELFGTMEPWSARPTGECVGLSDGVAVAWTAPRIRPFLDADSRLADDLLGVFGRGLGRVLERFDTVTFEGARSRLCRMLLAYAPIAFDPVGPVLSRGDLASFVGASREMTNRVLRELEASGAVRRLGQRGLVLLDETELRRHVSEAAAVGRRGSG